LIFIDWGELALSGLGLSVGLTTLPCKRNIVVNLKTKPWDTLKTVAQKLGEYFEENSTR